MTPRSSATGGAAVLRRARVLKRRTERYDAGRFLAEGPQAAGEALAAGLVEQLFVNPRASVGHAGLIEAALGVDVAVLDVDDAVLASLSDTVATQGIVALARMPVQPDLATVMGAGPRLIVVGVAASDPGNVGTLIRIADATGADAVILTEGSCDPFNAKAVRASTGSLFHLPVLVGAGIADVLSSCASAHVQTIATTGEADRELFDPATQHNLAAPTCWLFGNEAHGLSRETREACDQQIRIPIYGQAESLNLGSAAAVCLYASASAARASIRATPPSVPGSKT